jgi:type IV pilus assembly protein PilY1
MGRAVYVVNAATGALIWRASTDQTTETCPSGAECTTNADMAYAVPADIGIIDRDRDVNHYADRLYFGDTGANVWRANIGDPDPANWNLYRLASFNQPRGSETAASARRKFLYMPDVVAGPTSDIVLVGSGDREQPFDTSVVNRFYSFENDKDEMTAPAHLITDTSQSGSPLADDLVELNPSDWASGLTIAGERLGWFYTLKGITVAAGGSVTYRAGEKVVSSPVTINGISYFNTNLPTPTACGANLGEARIYALEYLTGKAPVFKNANDGSQASAFLTVPGGGYLPTGVPAVVEVGGKRREVLIAGPKVSQDIGVVQLQRRVRTYWFQGIDQ